MYNLTIGLIAGMIINSDTPSKQNVCIGWLLNHHCILITNDLSLSSLRPSSYGARSLIVIFSGLHSFFVSGMVWYYLGSQGSLASRS